MPTHLPAMPMMAVWVAGRRRMLGAACAGLLAPTAWAAGSSQEPARIVFPRDRGSHPQSRTEWWYITGHTRADNRTEARDTGFQITFFRSRPDNTQGMQSRFAARQLLFAHAAVTDVQGKRFWHDQRIARAGFDVAQASETDTNVRLRDWSLVFRDGAYRAQVQAADFSLQLVLTPTQAVLLQGDKGLSRKGPQPEQSSFYYSQPQLAFEGSIRIRGDTRTVRGSGATSANSEFKPGDGAAWLDHEWSDQIMHPQAVGWDWVGINLFDGSSLTAFRLRDKDGTAIWDGGSFRHPRLNGGVYPHVFSRGETLFQALRGWKSALTQALYPVEWLLRTPADNYVVRALLDNQELDSRQSTGTVYWEGLCDLFDSNRRHVGRGYLEMTGYAKPLVL